LGGPGGGIGETEDGGEGNPGEAHGDRLLGRWGRWAQRDRLLGGRKGGVGSGGPGFHGHRFLRAAPGDRFLGSVAGAEKRHDHQSGQGARQRPPPCRSGLGAALNWTVVRGGVEFRPKSHRGKIVRPEGSA
jgi:hypothetical protein